MKRKNNQTKGFTLIEMLVVTAVTAMLAMVSISNYRAAEKKKRVAFAIDGIIASINLAQTYTQAGKNTNNAQANCRIPQYYYIAFSYTNSYTMYALDNCGETDTIETFTLPPNTQINTSGLVMNSTPATTTMRIAFYPPFIQLKGGIDLANNNTFTTATITVRSADGTISKTATVDGVAGRISQ